MEATGKKGSKKLLIDILYDIISGISITIGICCFLSPNQIVPGGVSGIAIVVNFLTDVKMGTITMCVNLPLIILAFKFLGKKFTINTLKTILIQSVIMNIGQVILPQYTGEKILSSIFGAVFVGFSIAIVMMRGSTTGGTDIVSRLVQLRYPYLPIGKLMMSVDFFIIMSSIMVFKNVESGLYAIIVIFTMSKVIDGVLTGLNRGKVLLIFSEKSDDIAQEILETIDRGVTFLNGKGAYSGMPKEIILCAVRQSEYCSVEDVVKTVDNKAFMLTLDAGEIQGRGFRDLMEKKVT